MTAAEEQIRALVDQETATEDRPEVLIFFPNWERLAGD
jgi:hypothetical protein